MGTYTTNYNLFMPTVGETGWGDLVNGNFSTIDTTMKSLSNRITAVESEVNGVLSCTSVTTSGKVTANGGIAGTTGTFSGAVTGASFNGASITSTKFNNVLLKTNYTVTPTNTYVNPSFGDEGQIVIFTPTANFTYTGSIKINNTTSQNATIHYTQDFVVKTLTISLRSVGTISFSNIKQLAIDATDFDDYTKLSTFTIS